MEFRPCIDIVGGSLRDEGSQARENFVSEQDAAFYAGLYQRQGIRGGHVILLNKEGTEYFEATRQQALSALRAYPGGLQIGGGIRDDNAADYLNAGASAVIVTSYVFRDGQMNWKNLKKLETAVGADHLVLDVSCRHLLYWTSLRIIVLNFWFMRWMWKERQKALRNRWCVCLEAGMEFL